VSITHGILDKQIRMHCTSTSRTQQFYRAETHVCLTRKHLCARIFSVNSMFGLSSMPAMDLMWDDDWRRRPAAISMVRPPTLTSIILQLVRWPSWLWRQVKVILTYFLVTKVARVRVPFSSAFVCVADTPGVFLRPSFFGVEVGVEEPTYISEAPPTTCPANFAVA
jgi:hypothetical protein